MTGPLNQSTDAATGHAQRRCRKPAGKARHLTHELSRRLLETMYEGVIHVDAEGTIIETNPVAEAMFGLDRRDIVGQKYADLSAGMVNPDMKTMITSELAGTRAIEEKTTVRNIQKGIKRPDGTIVWVNVSAAPLLDRAGNVEGAVITYTDISTLHSMELRLRHLYDVMLTVRNVNQLIAQEDDEEKLLRGACAAIVSGRSYKQASISLISQGAKDVCPAARAGCHQDCVPSVSTAAGERKPEDGPTAETLHSGRPTVIHDIVKDGHHPSWRERAIAGGCASCASLPLRIDGRVAGAITVCSSQTETFGSEEIDLLQEIAGDLALGITKIRQRRALQRRTETIEAVNTVLSEALTAETEEQLGKVWLSTAEKLTGSKLSFMAEVDPRGQLNTIAISDSGLAACRIPRGRQSRLLGDFRTCRIFRRVVREGVSLVSNSPAHGRSGGRPPGGHPKISSFLCIPMKDRGRTVGIIGLADKEGGYSQEDRANAETLAMAIMQSLQRRRAETTARMRSVLLDNTSDAVLVGDRDTGRITYANEAAAAMLGRTHEDLCELGFEELVAPETLTVFTDQLPLLLTVGQARFESVMMKNDGTLVPVEINSRTHPVNSQHLVISVIRDISNRKQAEAAIRLSQERLRTFADSAPDSFSLYDANLNLVDINKTGLERRRDGARKENLIGKNLLELVPGIERSGRYQRYFEVIRTGSPFFADDIASDPNFVESRVNLRAFKVGDGLGIMVEDVTLQKALEEEIRRRARLLDATLDPVFLHDLDGNFLYVNEAAHRSRGYSEEEIMAMNLHELDAPENAQAIGRFMAELLAKGSLVFESAHRCKNGSIMPVEVNAQVIQLDGKDIILSVCRDLTERKRVQQLEAEAEAARLASQAKSDFLASMSHELRTPLNAILGFSEVLQEQYFGPLNDKQAEYIGDISASGRHLLSLINDILDLAKVESGKSTLDLSTVNLKDLLSSSLVMVREKAFKHNLRVDLRVADDVEGLCVRADERKLKQVIYNLLSNAVKFTPDGGAIRIEVRKTAAGVEVVVSDTGIGIAPEHLPRLFEEFYQVKGGLRDKTPGTGLGLALVKQLIGLHGGQVRVESDGIGKGSRFTFTLPA